ncbi:MAG: TonB-dependent receptor [Candidatus Glassbacteria bacterium]|nr:TonB-dependent receptor [Candidatus Glassbacteria bacterium]
MSKNGKLSGLSAALTAVVLLILLSFVPVSAQLNTAKLEGFVRDKDSGRPLAGAQVVVEGTRLGNVTNADGYYFVLSIPPGLRSISFSYTGYQKITVADQRFLAGHTVTLDATLSSTILQLEGITIEGESEALIPRDNTVTKQRLTAERLEESPATKLEDLMILEAGVQIGGEGGRARGLRIRGGRLGEEAMVVDGVIVRNYTANPFRPGAYWIWTHEEASLGEDTTPLEFSVGAVEEVDIITGGFQAEYGNAQSGIINIVTKEGGPRLKGNARITTDELNPRTANYGYNQLQVNIGGPVPFVPNLFYNGSGELQGRADVFPTHASEGFRGVNQDFVDHLNEAVRNDPVLGAKDIQPAFTLEEFQLGRAFFAEKMGEDPGLFSPSHPARQPNNWMDRTTVSGKLTSSPIRGLKLIGSHNFSRNQRTWPASGDPYFNFGYATPKMLPMRRWSADRGDILADGDTSALVPVNVARRTRTSNFLTGANWDFYQSRNRSASLQFRYTNFRTQDINSSNLKDNYVREDNTILSWSPHDIPFEVETWPGRSEPGPGIAYDPAVGDLHGEAWAKYYYPDGSGYWNRSYGYATPFGYEQNVQLYYMNYRYLKELQHNFKLDFDIQADRQNRVKFGVQATRFDNLKFETGRRVRELDNEFNYRPRMYGFYAQNRTDLGDFVFDYGLRYDSFQPRDNWAFRYGDLWGERYYPENFSEWSPRFDVAFPVTDRSQLRFSYGVFTQLPGLDQIFSGSNPGGLGFTRTDAFESGLSYLATEDIVLDLVAYYRDAEGNLASASFFRDYTQWHTGREVRELTSGYANADKGNIKGMDLTLKKRFSQNYSCNIVYTLQFSRTTGSSYLSSTRDDLRPMGGDRTHVFSTYLNYLFPEDFQAGSWVNPVLKNFRAYASFTFQSGQPTGDLSRRRGRWDHNLDLRLNKTFYLGSTRRLSGFVEIYNATNRKLPRAYPSGYQYQGYRYVTGGVDLYWEDATSVGKYLFQADFNQDGILTVMEAAKGAIANSMMSNLDDWSDWGIARQIRLGLDFSF